jgi:S-formylglutathione hydrolase
LVDQGSNDEFLSGQLKPHLLQNACNDAKHPLTLRMHDGYDHSYYFIASFIGEHIAYHSKHCR